MKINQAVFITSSTKLDQCPNPDKPEYAFIGRSNVGKSSLINMLTGRRKLVKVSGTPGKTITINHFLINDKLFFVDLPGYGFAKRSKTERAKWEKMIRNYILKRTNLLTIFLLIDMRHDPQKNDLEFMEWMAVSEVPFVLVFTKADKLKAAQKEKNLTVYMNHLAKDWEELPPYIVTSASTGIGKEEILDFVSKTNKVFKVH
jgi:GTP-binding protein